MRPIDQQVVLVTGSTDETLREMREATGSERTLELADD
jgi:hypothetical protein